MSTTIAKAFGNLERSNTMKERKRYRPARSNTAARTQQVADQQQPQTAQNELHAQPVQRSAKSGLRRSSSRDKNNTREVRTQGHESLQTQPRGGDRRASQNSFGHSSANGFQGNRPVSGGRDRSLDRDLGSSFEHAQNQYFTDENQAFGGQYDTAVEDDFFRTPLPHDVRQQTGHDLRVDQPRPQRGQQEPVQRRNGKSNGKLLRLPVNRMRSKNMITLDQPRSMLAEQYRAIRMQLVNNAGRPSADGLRPRSNLLMVTSALAGEGKTYTSTNLALSVSMEPDKSVLLVDADSSKGSLSRLLGVPKGTPGLMDVLMNDDLNIEDVIIKTDAPRFSIIPRGTPSEFATDLFSGATMQKLLFELSTRYDNRIVMLDTSPLLMTTEARALANFVDQIPFVVGAEKTTHECVEESLSYLSPEKYVGMILNMATRQTRAKYGYYN